MLIAAVLALSAYPFDDAFIHLRLARNLAFHGEPYFNLGERVMSGSSPLWLLWLAACFRMLGTASTAVAVATECVVVIALFVTCEGLLAHGRRRSGLTVLPAFLVSAIALPAAGGLMETPLAVALFFGALWAWRSDRLLLAGVVMAFAVTTRFEMALPAIGAVLIVPGWRQKSRFVAGAAPVGLVLLILLAGYYGEIVPQAMSAKAIVYQRERLDLFTMGPQELGRWTGGILIAVLCATTLGAVMYRNRGASSRFGDLDRVWLLTVLFPLVLLVIYACQTSLVFPWYWTMSVCPLALVALVLCFHEGRSSSWKARSLTAASVGVVLVLASESLIGVGAAVSGRLEQSPWLLENSRTRSYLRIGAVLAAQCRGTVVAAPEIGALGWTFDGRILDGVGLASPEVLRFHPLQVPDERISGGLGAIPGRAVAVFRPDVLVSMETLATDFTQKAAVMPELADYALWWKEPVFAVDLPAHQQSTLWGSRWILVFSRHHTAGGVGCPA